MRRSEEAQGSWSKEGHSVPVGACGWPWTDLPRLGWQLALASGQWLLFEALVQEGAGLQLGPTPSMEWMLQLLTPIPMETPRGQEKGSTLSQF